MTNKDNINNDLEYNDGLGDLLKEREKLEFSWVKTSVVFIVFLGLILGSLTFVFNLGKSYMSSRKLSKPVVTQENTQPTKTVVSTPSSSKVSSKPTPKQKGPIKKLSSSSTVKKPVYKFKVITGTFKNKQFALNQVNLLKQKGFDSFIKRARSTEGYSLYRVQAGAYNSRRDASSFQIHLKSNKFDSFIILE